MRVLNKMSLSDSGKTEKRAGRKGEKEEEEEEAEREIGRGKEKGDKEQKGRCTSIHFLR